MASPPSASPPEVEESLPAALHEEDEEDQVVPLEHLHATVQFYKGLWAIKMDSLTFTVVQLHQHLFPPAAVGFPGEVSDENYSCQLATTEGFTCLEAHWDFLLALLFPRTQLPLLQVESSSSLPLSREEIRHFDIATVQRYTQSPLSELDLKAIRVPGSMDRVYYSYIVMLRFFGWRVHDEQRGLLDRHRGWAERYAALSSTGDNLCRYESGLCRVLGSLLDIGFLTLAVRLVEFLIEEMSCGRLGYLQLLVEQQLLPMIADNGNVESSHKTRLKKRLDRLTRSDSD